MAVNLNTPGCEIKERRLGSITGYFGTIGDMTRKGCEGCLKNKKRCFTTVSQCSHYEALGQLAAVDDAVIIDHAPVGCSAGQVCFNRIFNLNVSKMIGERGRNFRIMSTDIKESDTVFGGLAKLRKTIRKAYDRYHPSQIYVVTSCVSAIIGEDANSVVEEMREELGIPIGFAASEGIKSKIWASGYDDYSHAVARTILKDSDERENIINYVGFSPLGKEYIEGFFERLGYKMNFLTARAKTEDYERASKAVASFGQCGAQSSYLCGALEKRFGVKYFQSHFPYGGIGFERFFREVGEYLGKQDEVEEIIREEREKYADRLERVREQLKGKKVFIALGATFAYEYTRIAGELGLEVIHTVAYHYDPRLDNITDERVAAAVDAIESGLENVSTSVNDSQQMETLLTMRNLEKPDVVISRVHETAPWSMKIGIPAVTGSASLNLVGYRALVEFGERIVEELKNKNFVTKLGKNFKSPFTEEYEQLKQLHFLQGGKEDVE